MFERDFKATMSGHTGIVYTEPGRKMFVFSEILIGGDYSVAVDCNTIKEWETPEGKVPATEDERRRVFKNLKYLFEEEPFEPMRIYWANCDRL